LRDLHRLPIVITGHAYVRLRERFHLVDEAEIKHYIRCSRVVKPFGKEGSVGVLECDMGGVRIRFKCLVKQKNLVVVTVEVG
jgi:hypothetical protein